MDNERMEALIARLEEWPTHFDTGFAADCKVAAAALRELREEIAQKATIIEAQRIRPRGKSILPEIQTLIDRAERAEAALAAETKDAQRWQALRLWFCDAEVWYLLCDAMALILFKSKVFGFPYKTWTENMRRTTESFDYAIDAARAAQAMWARAHGRF